VIYLAGEKLWLPPKRQQNRSNRHSNGKDLQHKTEDNVFVPTLSSGSLEESDSALAAQRARKNELMVKLKMAKTKDGSKRLGQRARQKLYEELFAANANHKTGVSGTGVGSQGGQVQGRKRKRQAPGGFAEFVLVSFFSIPLFFSFSLSCICIYLFLSPFLKPTSFLFRSWRRK